MPSTGGPVEATSAEAVQRGHVESENANRKGDANGRTRQFAPMLKTVKTLALQF